MISVKLQCDCGQRYAFDVEPVGGRMPQAVACPACGADGTAAAEQSLAEQLAGRALAAAEPREPPPQPLRRRGLLVAAVAVAAAAVAGVVWHYPKTTPNESLAGLEGLPRTAAELNAWYPVDFTELSLPHLFPLLNAVRLASLAAWIAADADQGELAGSQLLLGAALVASLEREPTLMSQLVRMASLTPLLEALEQTLSRVALPVDALERLQATLDRAAEAEAAGVGFTAALVGERALILEAFELPAGELPERWESILMDDTPAEVLLELPVQQRAYERFMADLLVARKEPLPARLDFERQAVATALRQASYHGHGLVEAMLRRPMWESAARREAEAVARWRLAQTAVALERWRAASNDRYPGSLGALSPNYLSAVPSGPFDGQPLRYRLTQSGYELACPGAGSDRITFTVAR